MSAYDRAIGLKPDYAEALNNKGFSLANLGRFQEAVSAYDRAIGLKPDYAGAWLTKEPLTGYSGNNRETIKCFEKFVEFAPPKYQYQVKEIEQLLIQLK